MRIRKLLAIFVLLAMTVAMIPGMTAFASPSDVDFTIGVDTDISYISGDTIAVPIQINNQTDKGYVELELFLTFDPDALNCLSIFENVDGFSAYVEERNGQTGLVIKYVSPDGQPSVTGIKTVKVEFAVITGVASGEYTLSLQVVSCYGFDADYSKKDAVQEDGVLTLSMAKDKKLTIIETNDNAVGGGTGDGSTPNYYYNEPTVTQKVDRDDDKDGSTVGRVLLIIFGAIIVFAAGVVVGFILCQKRMLEDGYGREPEDLPPRNPAGARGRFGDMSSGFHRSVYDEEEESADDYYSERLSGKRAPSRRPSVLDDDIDTSYFGRAAETQLGGSRTAFDDDDDYADDFTPRRYGGAEAPADDYGSSLDFLGSHRRERDDDGYGSFGGGSDDTDDGDDDYFSDRRRYR